MVTVRIDQQPEVICLVVKLDPPHTDDGVCLEGFSLYIALLICSIIQVLSWYSHIFLFRNHPVNQFISQKYDIQRCIKV